MLHHVYRNCWYRVCMMQPLNLAVWGIIVPELLYVWANTRCETMYNQHWHDQQNCILMLVMWFIELYGFKAKHSWNHYSGKYLPCLIATGQILSSGLSCLVGYTRSTMWNAVKGICSSMLRMSFTVYKLQKAWLHHWLFCHLHKCIEKPSCWKWSMGVQ